MNFFTHKKIPDASKRRALWQLRRSSPSDTGSKSVFHAQ